jgi:O-antigen ligase
MVKAILLEKILLVTLALLSISLFFSQSGISIFGPLSLIVLLVWRYAVKYEPAGRMPKYLVAAVIIFMLDIFLGGVMSDNYAKGLAELKKYWNVLLCGLLFACPMSSTNRKRLIIVFFLAACLAGLMGMLQHFGILFEKWKGWRAHGFTHPIHYAGILAFACSTSLMMLLIKNNVFSSLKERVFLVLTVSLSLTGILLSQTRGVWLALIASCLIVLFIYNFKKAVIYLAVMIALSASVFAASDGLMKRAHSIVASARYFYSEDDRLKKPPRYDVWKGALIIFKESPVLGTGTGDFTEDMDRLVSEGKINKKTNTRHAHNIYLQWLATQGIVGLLSLVALLTSLIIWGLGDIRKRGGLGGYIIVLAVLLTVTGGLTENNIGISKYFAAWCFTIGLLGGMGSSKGEVDHDGTSS